MIRRHSSSSLYDIKAILTGALKTAAIKWGTTLSYLENAIIARKNIFVTSPVGFGGTHFIQLIGNYAREVMSIPSCFCEIVHNTPYKTIATNTLFIINETSPPFSQDFLDAIANTHIVFMKRGNEFNVEANNGTIHEFMGLTRKERVISHHLEGKKIEIYYE